MPVIICDYCGSKFYKKASQIKRSLKHFCSPVCQHKSRRSGVVIACYVCKTEVYKTKKSLTKSKNKKFFCSIRCSNKWHGEEYSQAKHPNWKTGEYSYRAMMERVTKMPKCSLCDTDNFKVLTVHHIDQNRKNNKIYNLAWLCYNCHFLAHNYKVEQEKFFKKINATH